MSEAKTLAVGAALTPETFAEFVARLKFHNAGEGVAWHSTADAIFCVQAKRIVTGIDRDYTDDWVIYIEDSRWFDPVAFYNDRDEDVQSDLNKMAAEHADNEATGFLSLSPYEQWGMVENLEDCTVTGYDWRWDHVNSHFTKEAAEAFIKRKAHDYPEGLRVYVDAQLYCWEWNAIKAALMDGRLVMKDAA